MSIITQPGSRQAQERQIRRFLAVSEAGCQVVRVSENMDIARMATDVATGLADPVQKRISSTYLYDRQGSELYEKITLLPEYYPTRTEAAILRQYAGEISREFGPERSRWQIVELGSGSSVKTRILLEAWQTDHGISTYIPIDISHDMLADTARQLSADYDGIRVLGLCGEYLEALTLLPPDPHRLILFLGGTIGNFSRTFQRHFFEQLRRVTPTGARLLLGFDLTPHDGKPEELIRRAYDDQAGITAQFNLNILAHLNHALGADFDLSAWEHQAVYNKLEEQIEMYLASARAQTVSIQALEKEYRFEPGERILTEISRRFDPEALAQWFETAGFRRMRQWTDPARYFELMLLETI